MGKESIIAIIFILFLLFFWNPFGLWMTEMQIFMIVAGLFVITAIYAGLILREQPKDEREEKHRAIAGRIGFISGIVVLVVALAVQSFNSHPDLWLVATLAVMIISKMFALLWKKHSE